MLVLKGRVTVFVRMRLPDGVERGVFVLVVFVVRMTVLMLQAVMHMDVVVLLTEEQRDAEAHKNCRS